MQLNKAAQLSVAEIEPAHRGYVNVVLPMTKEQIATESPNAKIKIGEHEVSTKSVRKLTADTLYQYAITKATAEAYDMKYPLLLEEWEIAVAYAIQKMTGIRTVERDPETGRLTTKNPYGAEHHGTVMQAVKGRLDSHTINHAIRKKQENECDTAEVAESVAALLTHETPYRKRMMTLYNPEDAPRWQQLDEYGTWEGWSVQEGVPIIALNTNCGDIWRIEISASEITEEFVYQEHTDSVISDCYCRRWHLELTFEHGHAFEFVNGDEYEAMRRADDIARIETIEEKVW